GNASPRIGRIAERNPLGSRGLACRLRAAEMAREKKTGEGGPFSGGDVGSLDRDGNPRLFRRGGPGSRVPRRRPPGTGGVVRLGVAQNSGGGGARLPRGGRRKEKKSDGGRRNPGRQHRPGNRGGARRGGNLGGGHSALVFRGNPALYRGHRIVAGGQPKTRMGRPGVALVRHPAVRTFGLGKRTPRAGGCPFPHAPRGFS